MWWWKEVTDSKRYFSAYRYWWTWCVCAVSRGGNRCHRPPSPVCPAKKHTHKQAHINNKLLSGGSYENLYILLTHSNLQSLKRPTDNIWCLSLCKKKKQQLLIFLPFSPGQLTTQMQKKGMEARDADRKKGRMEAWSERENKHCLMTVTD